MIAKMDKLTFLIYHKEYEHFLERLRELGVVHVELRQQGEGNEELQALLQRRSAYKNVLKEMSTWAAGATPSASASQASVDESLSVFELRQSQLQQLTAQLPAVESEIAQLEPWG